MRILDTRKTTPGLRALEKEAVRAGGGVNHRNGLYDAILVKENHAALAGGVGGGRRGWRWRLPAAGVPVEVECATLDEVGDALDAGVPRVLLDNMTPDELRAGGGARRRPRRAGGLREGSRSRRSRESRRPA